MPLFDYKALNSAGKPVRGNVESENQRSARAKLKKQGLMVTTITEKTTASQARSGGGIPFLAGRVNGQQIAMMTRQLASLVRANVPLVEALNALVDQTEQEQLKVTLSKVRDDVNEGSSLAKAMAQHPKIFDNIFVNMVEAGEASGTIGMVLIKLADLKESQMRLRAKVVGGMTYPGLMLLVSISMILIIFTVVVPKLAKIFEGMNKPMPPQTEFLIGLSNLIVDYWYAIFGATGLAVYLFLQWKKSTAGRSKWDRMQLNAPLFGSMVRMVGVTRFASTMSTLLTAGVPILTAMGIARNLVGNVHLAKAIEDARNNITEGQSIADPLRRSGEFPPLVIHMISIGEKTGELPNMLKNISENYEEQVSNKIASMTSLIEPMMIIFMGGIVGFVVVSIFVPLLEMNNIGG